MIANQNTRNLETGFEYEQASSVPAESAERDAVTSEKWPLGVRVLIIVGLSCLSWAGIFVLVRTIFF